MEVNRTLVVGKAPVSPLIDSGIEDLDRNLDFVTDLEAHELPSINHTLVVCMGREAADAVGLPHTSEWYERLLVPTGEEPNVVKWAVAVPEPTLPLDPTALAFWRDMASPHSQTCWRHTSRHSLKRGDRRDCEWCQERAREYMRERRFAERVGPPPEPAYPRAPVVDGTCPYDIGTCEGSRSMYVHGCRSEPCCSENRIYQADWMAANRTGRGSRVMTASIERTVCSDEMKVALIDRAIKDNTTQAEIVRRAISEYLKTEKTP